MINKSSQKKISIFLIILAVIICIFLAVTNGSLAWYWTFGIAFGCVLQKSGLCFVSSAGDLYSMNSTTQLRSILVGILVASLGISSMKYLSFGEMDYLSVSAISIPLVLGAFMFGIGMILSGACASGMFIRLAEGFSIHIFTIISLVIGFMISRIGYADIWGKMVAKGIVVFLPDTFGWLGGIGIHLAIILILYYAALKIERGQSGTQSQKYLLGGIFLGVFSILHYIILQSGWSITGAFFWFSDIIGISEPSQAVADLINYSIAPNIRNIGLFAGAFISVFFAAEFRLKKIKSLKQVLMASFGGLLMGYGAGIAGGCNITSFFTACASLSLSGWVFMLFLFAGAFVGVKVLMKLM